MDSIKIMDYYDLLGVKPDCTQKEIDDEIKRMQIDFHPDRNPNNRLVQEIMKLINEAKSKIGTPELRKEYDERLRRYKESAENQPVAPKPKFKDKLKSKAKEIIDKAKTKYKEFFADSKNKQALDNIKSGAGEILQSAGETLFNEAIKRLFKIK